VESIQLPNECISRGGKSNPLIIYLKETMKQESQIQKECLDICKEHPNIEWIDRANSGKVRTKGGFIQLHEEGTSDTIGFLIDARFIAIEYKTEKEYYGSKDFGLKPKQREFIDRVNDAGGIAGVACSKETLQEILDRI
jgi:hypothetical protein